MNKYDDIKRFMDKTKLENLDYKELNEKSTGESITGSMNQWTLIKQVSASEEPAGPLDNGRSTQPTPQAISADEFSLSVAQPVPEYQAAQRPVTHAQSAPLSSEVPPPAAGFGLLDALRETLPPAAAKPAPAPVQPAQHQPVHTAPTLHAQAVIPDSGSGLLDSLRKAMPEAPKSPAPAPAQPAPVQASQPVQQPAATVYHQPPVQNSAPAYPPAPVHSPAPVMPASPSSADVNQRFKQMFKQRAPQPASAYLHRDTPLQPLLEMIASCR
ncbi:cellulose biosynthesis protein BcsO [Rahnella woolbedingensis]|uniref:Cellulose biosynthesis protein BcsO n=1 Tax=Rahnella woolbedingensis TaxID=1510574 RepID=A0A419N9H5_9GAMM|nr:cellulose biosynthesis protein BcsO [Rahnella woolbedingensis]RJT44288.1 cellulose biosynthesis protein BcsO [Rahnella woolbedingensis]